MAGCSSVEPAGRQRGEGQILLTAEEETSNLAPVAKMEKPDSATRFSQPSSGDVK